MKGGARPGAGRPRKSLSAARVMNEHAQLLADKGLVPMDIALMSPLEVMLSVMHIQYHEGIQTRNMALLKDAAISANSAASYTHPKLSHVINETTGDPSKMTIQELMRQIEGDADADGKVVSIAA